MITVQPSPTGLSRQLTARPSPLACSQCRQRHLKCDAKLPVCARCASNSLECSYTPSRRGGVCRAKRKASHQHEPRRQSPSGIPSGAQNASTLYTPSQNPTNGDLISVPPSLVRADSVTSITPPSTITDALPGCPDVDEEHLTNLFYTNFYLAHPILVPKYAYHRQAYPDYLRLVVCFVGSQYAATNHPKDALRQLVSSTMAETTERSPQKVQALTLYSIVLHAQNQAKEAATCIAQATGLAIAIGLNKPAFAADASPGYPYQEESFRRTWWELYVVDGYMAALRRQPTFRSNAVNEHPYLPCEESVFAQGVINLSPLSLGQFEDRVFAKDTDAFSSYCYRIEAIRIIARVLAVAGANNADPDEVQAVDNAIASWKYHLPRSKTDVIDQYGRVDHMLFQANVFIQWATILLHFPRSDLPLTVPTNTTTDFVCAGPDDMPQRMSATSAQHTVKATAASKELSNLAALPWCVNVHSPFFTSGLILGCIVQLSACSSHARSCLQQHRDRVTLMIGALKTLGETWAVARNVLGHLMKVAKGIFCCSGEKTPVCGYEMATADDMDVSGLTGVNGDMMWFDLFTMEEMGIPAPVFGAGTLD